jgi:hypothetical protein
MSGASISSKSTRALRSCSLALLAERGDGRHDVSFDNNKLAQLFHCASDALGSDVVIEAPWRMADWIIAHHNAALDQRERDYLLRWAAARRADPSIVIRLPSVSG